MKLPGSTGFNLDRFCAEQGDTLARAVASALDDAKKADNLITKALSVLQEQGLYAYVLFCRSRGDGENVGALKLEEVTSDMLADERLNLVGTGDLLEEIRRENGLASDLEKLLLACKILEQALIYARYHAKAMNKKTPSGGDA